MLKIASPPVLASLVTTGLAILSCRSAGVPATSAPAECEARFPSTARLFEPTASLDLAGEYRLILVSTPPQDAGRTEGRLSLWVADTLRRYYEPRYLTIRDSTTTSGLRIRSSRVVPDSIVGWWRSGVDRPLLGALEIDLQAGGCERQGAPGLTRP